MENQWDATKYCSKCSAKLEIIENYKQCTGCGKRFYFNAKPCAAIWLSNSKGEILLTKRAGDPFKDWWDTPGGFVEENETLEDAARRELMEETGLKVTDLQYMGSLFEDYNYGGEIVPIVAVFFEGKIDGNEVVKVDDDVSDYKFVPLEEIDFGQIAFDNQREFLRKINKIK